jgi:hypothetical protein
LGNNVLRENKIHKTYISHSSSELEGVLNTVLENQD